MLYHCAARIKMEDNRMRAWTEHLNWDRSKVGSKWAITGNTGITIYKFYMFLFLYKDIKSQNVSENGQLFTFLRAQKIRPATIMIVSSPLSCCMTPSHRRLPGAGRGAAISIIKFNWSSWPRCPSLSRLQRRPRYCPGCRPHTDMSAMFDVLDIVSIIYNTQRMSLLQPSILIL